MKMSVQKEEKKFQPVTVSITFESKEEISAIRGVMNWNVTIPALWDGNANYQEIVVRFMREMCLQLDSTTK